MNPTNSFNDDNCVGSMPYDPGESIVALREQINRLSQLLSDNDPTFSPPVLPNSSFSLQRKIIQCGKRHLINEVLRLGLQPPNEVTEMRNATLLVDLPQEIIQLIIDHFFRANLMTVNVHRAELEGWTVRNNDLTDIAEAFSVSPQLNTAMIEVLRSPYFNLNLDVRAMMHKPNCHLCDPTSELGCTCDGDGNGSILHPLVEGIAHKITALIVDINLGCNTILVRGFKMAVYDQDVLDAVELLATIKHRFPRLRKLWVVLRDSVNPTDLLPINDFAGVIDDYCSIIHQIRATGMEEAWVSTYRPKTWRLEKRDGSTVRRLAQHLFLENRAQRSVECRLDSDYDDGTDSFENDYDANEENRPPVGMLWKVNTCGDEREDKETYLHWGGV